MTPDDVPDERTLRAEHVFAMTCRPEIPAPDEYVLEQETLAAMQYALRKLKPRQRTVVRLRLGLDGTNETRPFTDVAKRVGLSMSRTCEIFARATWTMRCRMKHWHAKRLDA